MFLLAAGTLGAQTPPTSRPTSDSSRATADSLALDSLRARLARAEAAIELLRGQLATESETSVKTRSRTHLDISARVLMNVFATYGRVNNVDDPQTALPPALPGNIPPSDNALGFTVRQTTFGAAASVNDVLGGTFSGDVDFDLFGGVQNGAGDRRLFPEPRLRTARGRLSWARTEIMVGQETPLISDLSPISLAAIGTPAFSGAGNLWNWLGQIRVTQDVGSTGRVQWALQGAVMTPYQNTVAAGDPDGADAGERSGIPSFEGRVRSRWGAAIADDGVITSDGLIGPRGGEIGIGAHRGWIEMERGQRIDSYAVSADAHVVFAPHVEIRGEAYTGRILRGLGGGGIAQNFGRPVVGAPASALGTPVHDVAGWAQLNVQPHPVTMTGVGCGIDLVNNDSDPVRLQNTVCSAYVSWRPMQPLVLGLEYRQFGTRFSTGTSSARTFNLAIGFEL